MSDSAPTPARSIDSVIGAFVFIGALLVSLWFVRVGWNNRLSDTHPFRQTQTALSAYWMVRDGIRLDYSTPVMGAPWSIPMEFPTYQAAVATVAKLSGLELESAARLVSLFFFYASLPAIWLLLRRLTIPPGACWLFLALVLTCPVYLFYSRAVLVESTAFCFGCWFLYAFHVALHSRHLGDEIAAGLFAALAGATKVTTFAVFLAAAFALGLYALRGPMVRRSLLWRRGLLAVTPGILAAVAWVYYSDAVKRRNVFGVMMTSSEQRDWNYGPLALRTSGAFWNQLGEHVRAAIASGGALIVFAVLAALFLRGRTRVFFSLLAVAIAGPLVFANLYFVHDYYLYANGIFFLALLALPLLEIFRRAEIGPAARWGVALLVLAVQVLGYLQSYYPRQNTVADAPEIARAIRVVTAPDDVLLGFGMNWSSILPYFSERRAVMVPDRFARDDAAIQQAIARVGAEHITAVVMFRLTQPGPEAFAPWLKKLGMDENPFMQTGEFNVYLRKDREPDALKKLASFPFKDVLLYGGQLNAAGQKPGVLYWVEQVPDRKIFSMMKPEPVRVTVPFGLGAEMLEGRYVFTAHSTSEVEIPAPAGARFITAQFGLNPAVYDRSDGIVVEIVNQSVNAGPQELFRRYLRPNVIKGDQGVQEVTLETTQPLTGTVRFRILPGGGPNFDWAYWAKIEIR